MPITILSGAIKYKKNGNFNALDCIKGDPATSPVQDVQVNGTSILNQGVANVPYASGSAVGVVKVNGDFGTSMRSSPNDNTIMLQRAAADDIQAGVQKYKPITPSMVDVATFFGLSRVAGVDLASETVTLGQYPDPALVAIQKMLGINQQWELIRHIETTQDLTEVLINTDQYGEGFELKRLMVYFSCGQSTTGARDSFYTQVYGNNSLRTNGSISTPSLTYVTATSAMRVQIDVETHGIAPVTTKAIVAAGDGNTQNITGMAKPTQFDVLTGYKIYQSASDKSLIPSGAIIDLYGIRA